MFFVVEPERYVMFLALLILGAAVSFAIGALINVVSLAFMPADPPLSGGRDEWLDSLMVTALWLVCLHMFTYILYEPASIGYSLGFFIVSVIGAAVPARVFYVEIFQHG